MTISERPRDVVCRLGNRWFYIICYFIEGYQQAKFQIHTKLKLHSANRRRPPPPLRITWLLELCVQRVNKIRGVSRTSSKSRMEIFVTKVLTFVTKISILDFVVVLDAPLKIGSTNN